MSIPYNCAWIIANDCKYARIGDHLEQSQFIDLTLIERTTHTAIHGTAIPINKVMSGAKQ